MVEPTVFDIVILPRPDDSLGRPDHASKLALKFRSLRLYALQTSPEAFASSYAMESERGIDHTFERLNNPYACHFIVVNKSDGLSRGTAEDDYIDRLVQADWFGMIVLNGPLREPSETAVPAKSDPVTQGNQNTGTTTFSSTAGSQAALLLRFHLTGTFVHPKARKGGVGAALLKEALVKAESEARKMGVGMRCSVLVDSENVPAQQLYIRSGFTITGEETYLPQPRELLGESLVMERLAWHLELTRAGSELEGAVDLEAVDPIEHDDL